MNELASRYALALYNLSLEEDRVLEYQEQIKVLIKVIKDNIDILNVLDSDFMTLKGREAIVDHVFKNVDKSIINFIKVIINNNRSLHLLDIFYAFNSLCNEYRGVKEGLVYSTSPLNEKELALISETIAKKEGVSLELKNEIDPTLIGGVKVVVKDHIYDGSVKFHIESMKNSLLKKEEGNL